MVGGGGGVSGAATGVGGVEVHGVVGAVVSVLGSGGWVGWDSVAHDDIIIAVSKVSDVQPGGIIIDFTDKELLDLGLQTRDEVVAEISRVTAGQVGDDALELVTIGLDRGGLAEATDVLAGFVLGVRVT
jgi:hypothetical protein